MQHSFRTPYWYSHSVIFNLYQIVKNYGIWKISSFYCCIRRSFHLRYLYRFYHSRATRTWSVCNEIYHNVFRYEYLTFQTQIHLHKQYIFDTNINQSEYAFLFPFSKYHDFRRPLPYKFLQLALHKNMSGSHMTKSKHFHWVKLVRGKTKQFVCRTNFLCRLRSIAAHRDHFVRRLSVCPSVCLFVR